MDGALNRDFMHSKPTIIRENDSRGKKEEKRIERRRLLWIIKKEKELAAERMFGRIDFFFFSEKSKTWELCQRFDSQHYSSLNEFFEEFTQTLKEGVFFKFVEDKEEIKEIKEIKFYSFLLKDEFKKFFFDDIYRLVKIMPLNKSERRYGGSCNYICVYFQKTITYEEVQC